MSYVKTGGTDHENKVNGSDGHDGHDGDDGDDGDNVYNDDDHVVFIGRQRCKEWTGTQGGMFFTDIKGPKSSAVN